MSFIIKGRHWVSINNRLTNLHCNLGKITVSLYITCKIHINWHLTNSTAWANISVYENSSEFQHFHIWKLHNKFNIAMWKLHKSFLLKMILSLAYCKRFNFCNYPLISWIHNSYKMPFIFKINNPILISAWNLLCKFIWMISFS